jgi:hypothetical protein
MMLAGFVPVFAAIFAPESAKYALIGLGALTAVVGLAMLARQGPFQPHPRPGRPRAGGAARSSSQTVIS